MVRPRPRRAMRTHLGVQIAKDRVPPAPESALGGAVACAVAPADHDVAAHKPKGFAWKSLRPGLELKVTGSRYATAALNSLAEGRGDLHVVGVVHRERKPSITATITSAVRVVSYQGRGRWGQHNSFIARED